MIHEDHEATSGPTPWTSLFQAFSEAFEWALDLAGGLARAYPEEVATVERVRTFARRRTAGDPAHIRLDDLLFTFGLIAGALERDVRPLITPARVESARAIGTPASASTARPIGTPAPARLPASTLSLSKPARTLKARRAPRSAPIRGAHGMRASAASSRGAAAVARDRWAH